MSDHYPIVFEVEADGAVSAYVPGLPVYAQQATHARTERAIRATLAAYLEAHPDAPAPPTAVRVATVERRANRPPTVTIVGPGALLGRRRSPAKAASARANGRLGGRPRLTR